ncbi:MAG TPA: glutathione S-transferase family protein [Terriglobales bacterium]|nr:glutathione S-transferase family protein [Terriglobales bacterium]
MDQQVTVFGAAYSVYVRSVRLALEEKGIAYLLNEIDVFAPGGPPAELLQRQPFGRIPAFEHRRDGAVFALYETAAILRYVDEAFAGPKLQPSAPMPRARMNQLLSILDNYAYRILVWDIYVERVSHPKEGKPSDEARIAAALPRARTCLDAISGLMGQGPWLAGADISLADLHAAAVFAYFTRTPEAGPLLRAHDGLQHWWQRIQQRDSLRRTAYAGE